MEKRLANVVSYLFHPLLMATILVGTCYFFVPSVFRPLSESSIGYIILMVFILTFIIPLISIAMLRFTSSIESFKMVNRKERILPFFFVTVYYGLTTYLFATKVVLSTALIIIFSAITFTILIVAIVTLFYKISAHSAGIWGVVGFLIALNFKFPDSFLFYPIIVAIILAGLVNSSRLLLNQHDIEEVIMGSILGFVVSLGSMLYYL